MNSRSNTRPAVQDAAADGPRMNRIMHELKRRELTVARAERLTPHMIRVWLTGESMADFPSQGPSDHVRIVLPGPDGVTETREYTPRAFDRARRELVIDFADHEAGPATRWARSARPGDRLIVAGPRGSMRIEGVRDWILIGDETALPAIGRRLEELEPEARARVFVAVPGAQDEQRIESRAKVEYRWIHRPPEQATDAAPFLSALEGIEIGAGVYTWIAAEADVARAVRAFMVGRGAAPAWVKAAGYWSQGRADGAVKLAEGSAD